jgi:hypothetical protein
VQVAAAIHNAHAARAKLLEDFVMTDRLASHEVSVFSLMQLTDCTRGGSKIKCLARRSSECL